MKRQQAVSKEGVAEALQRMRRPYPWSPHPDRNELSLPYFGKFLEFKGHFPQ
jgi:hypothetical protein